MSKTQPLTWTTIRSFVGDASFLGAGDAVEEAVKSATVQAENYFEQHLDGDRYKIVATCTQAISTGDYFNYIITLTIEIECYNEEEDEREDNKVE